MSTGKQTDGTVLRIYSQRAGCRRRPSFFFYRFAKTPSLCRVIIMRRYLFFSKFLSSRLSYTLVRYNRTPFGQSRTRCFVTTFIFINRFSSFLSFSLSLPRQILFRRDDKAPRVDPIHFQSIVSFSCYRAFGN